MQIIAQSENIYEYLRKLNGDRSSTVSGDQIAAADHFPQSFHWLSGTSGIAGPIA